MEEKKHPESHEHETGHKGHGEGVDHEHQTDRQGPGERAAPRAPAAHGEGASHTHDGHDSHGNHDAHSPEVFRRRFWVVLLLTLPVLAYSHHIQMWFNFRPPSFPGSPHIPFILGTIIFFYGGRVFLQGGWDELRQKNPGMMTLISLAISVAFLYSLLVTLGFPGEELYWELATLVTIMLLGHWLEMSSIQKARGALQELAALLPDTAWLVTPEGEKEVSTRTLQPGSTILVRPGSRIPADGRVLQGESYVNEAVLTGEAHPVPKGPGSDLSAGTLNEDGSLRVQVDKTFQDTSLAKIMALVRETQASRSRTQILADRAAFWLVLAAITAALVTAVAWTAAGADTVFIMERVVTVLIIACPHALGLAIPLVVAISTVLAARNGLLIKDRLALEKARLIDCVVFDKTGTLTSGELGLAGIYPEEGTGADELLELAAAAESDSEHTIARGIVAAAGKKGIKVPAPDAFEALPGRGVKALVQGKEVYVGGPNLLDHLKLRRDKPADESGGNKGHGQIYVVSDNRIMGSLSLSDSVRQESREAVKALQEEGIKVVMLTGDSEEAAGKTAGELAISSYLPRCCRNTRRTG